MTLSPPPPATAVGGSGASLPSSPSAPEDPVSVLCALFPTASLTSRERAWLTRGCLERFLSASGQDAGKALSRLLAALHWRSLNGVWGILREATSRRSPVRSTGASGRLYVLPQADHRGRAVVVCRPARDGGVDDAGVLELIVYTAERACRVAGEGQIVLVVDCTGLTRENAPRVDWVRRVAQTMADMYPERLAHVLVFNAPRVMRVAVAAAFRFASCFKRKKLHFSRDARLAEGVRSDPVDWKSVPLAYRGETLYEFDARKYFLTKLPAERSMSYISAEGENNMMKDGMEEAETQTSLQSEPKAMRQIKKKLAKATNMVKTEGDSL